MRRWLAAGRAGPNTIRPGLDHLHSQLAWGRQGEVSWEGAPVVLSAFAAAARHA